MRLSQRIILNEEVQLKSVSEHGRHCTSVAFSDVTGPKRTPRARLFLSQLRLTLRSPLVTVCITTLNGNLSKPTGHVMHQQFNIQQLYVLPTLYLCVLYLSENKQRLVPLTA